MKHVAITALITLGLTGLLSHCAKKGASPAGGGNQGGGPATEQNQETGDGTVAAGTTTVTTAEPKRYVPAGLSCTAPKVQAAPTAPTGVKVIDGEAGDWDLAQVLMTDPAGDSHGDGDLVSVRAQLGEDDLWLLLELAPSAGNDEIRLDFGRLQITPEQMLHNESFRSIVIQGTAVRYENAGGGGAPISGSQVARKGRFVEAKIPIGSVKYALASPSWWWQVGYFSLAGGAGSEPRLMDMMARRYFPSQLPTNDPTWFFESCKLSEQPAAPRLWVLRNYKDRDQAYINKLKVARHGAASASQFNHELRTKRLDDLTFLAVRDVAGQKHTSSPKMPNRSMMALMAEPLTSAAMQKQQFEAIVATLTDYYLQQSHRQFSTWPLAPIFREALTTASQCEVLGIETYLRQFPGVSHAPARPFQEFAQLFLASFPVTGLYRFIEGLDGTEDLAAVTAAALRTRLSVSEVPGNICQKLPRLNQVTLDDVWAGWLDKDQPYQQRFHPQALMDRDGDSLPQLWEDHLRLDSQNFDTDRDGFSDVTELIAATSPTDDLSYPGTLIIDREFSDWHKLMGSLVTADTDPSTSQCAASMDLLYSGAIYDHPNMHVAFQYRPIGHTFPYYFEVRLNFTGKPHPFMAVIHHDKPGFVVKNAATGEAVYTEPFQRVCGQRACDFSLPLAPMGVSSPTIPAGQPVTVQVKAYQLSAQPRLCDQTALYTPIVRPPAP